MTIPTALAPTAKLATPKVEKFVKGLLELFGPSAKLTRFFLCGPSTNEIQRGKEKWIEANWGADITANNFSLSDLETMQQKSKTIGIGDLTIQPHTNTRLQIRLWLFARVMRY